MISQSDMWIEWIPNISTGNIDIVEEIEDLFTLIPNLFLLHKDCSPEVNRTVFTLVGTPTSLRKALFVLFSALVDKIDMAIHTGTHPRMGALDVCPYVLLKNGSTSELLIWVAGMAREISRKFNFPIYLYEDSASEPHRKNLAIIRQGEYEGLRRKIADPDWLPDFEAEFHPGLGATAMGARDFLIAYNVNLDSSNTDLAKEIARQIRTKGNPNRSHRLAGVKAIGWYLQESGFCQVSTNITQTRHTTPLDVFTRCQRLAKELGCRVTGSELIALIPNHSVAKMMSQGPYTTSSLTSHMGLNYCGIKDLKERIIEHKVYIASGKSLFNEIFELA